MATTLEETPLTFFTANDRCDRCGAQAIAKATKGNKELIFCRHHRDAHTVALRDGGWTITNDEVLEENLLVKV